MVEHKPITFVDKMGDRFDLTACTRTHWPALFEMYDHFAPMAVTQGLPPIDEKARHAWVSGVLASGENFLAWRGDHVVGHCSLILGEDRADGEYLIFVNQPYRNRGLGTALTRMAVDRAAELGVKAIWLTVEALNFRAIKLYKKIGFVFCDAGERERTMILHLRAQDGT